MLPHPGDAMGGAAAMARVRTSIGLRQAQQREGAGDVVERQMVVRTEPEGALGPFDGAVALAERRQGPGAVNAAGIEAG